MKINTQKSEMLIAEGFGLINFRSIAYKSNNYYLEANGRQISITHGVAKN